MKRKLRFIEEIFNSIECLKKTDRSQITFSELLEQTKSYLKNKRFANDKRMKIYSSTDEFTTLFVTYKKNSFYVTWNQQMNAYEVEKAVL